MMNTMSIVSAILAALAAGTPAHNAIRPEVELAPLPAPVAVEAPMWEQDDRSLRETWDESTGYPEVRLAPVPVEVSLAPVEKLDSGPAHNSQGDVTLAPAPVRLEVETDSGPAHNPPVTQGG